MKHDLLLNLMDCLDMQLHEDAKTRIKDQYVEDNGMIKY